MSTINHRLKDRHHLPRKTIGELFADLKNDPKMRILFVEGNRDLAFWREIVPLSKRKDTVIYSIGVIEVKVETGGERGRLFLAITDLGGELFDPLVKMIND
jgi:hypothetical protein